MGLTNLDWWVIGVYLAAMIGLSVYLGRGQRSPRDYYLGGNKTGALPIALSTMATQCSTNSLLGAPAFVALTAGGGLLWLQYELAVPLAMIGLMLVFFPVFRALQLISVYSYLEQRFGVSTRTAVSVLFQFLRAFSTGVTVYAISLVLMICLGIEYWIAALLLGGVTVVYDMIGGMRAVIWSDVIQLVVLWGTILGALVLMVALLGGWEAMWALAPAERKVTLDWTGHGLGDGETFAFWPMLVGGFFLYLAYYGTDQTQAQRTLATRSNAEAYRALFLGGLLRFPLVLSYCLLGVALAAWIAAHPDFLETLAITAPGDEPGTTNYNLAVPVFVLQQFPAGLVGVVMVGLFAAAMSSLDSTINSLSALTQRDLLTRFGWGPRTDRGQMWVGKLLTLFWGVVCVGFSFLVGGISPTVIEAVNKIGSLLNGPLLGVFTLGLLWARANTAGSLAGLAAGLLFNAALAAWAPGISWLWWNVSGWVVCLGVGMLVSLLGEAPDQKRQATTWRALRREGVPLPGRAKPVLLGAAALGMILVLVAIGYM